MTKNKATSVKKIVDSEIIRVVHQLTEKEFLHLMECNAKTAENVHEMSELLLRTPINGYANMHEALTQISHVTESLRDRWSFWKALKNLKERNKPLYYFVTYLLILACALLVLVHINALVHPWGYSVDFVGSAKQQKVVVVPDTTQIIEK